VLPWIFVAQALSYCFMTAMVQWRADQTVPCPDCCAQVAGRSPTGDSDNTGRASAAALDPVKLAKLRAANEIVRASWQYKVGHQKGSLQHTAFTLCLGHLRNQMCTHASCLLWK
jgi:hypothetical protein